MASTIDLRGLERFMTRVQTYGKLLVDFNDIMQDILNHAKEYAEKEYANYGHSDIELSIDPKGTYGAIYAKGNAVAFFEFGTGDVGSGTYPDQSKLPKSGVPLTESWVYYYESDAKRTSHGVRGWFWDNKFRTGNKAEAEMWRTSMYIQRKAKSIIKAHLRAKGGG